MRQAIEHGMFVRRYEGKQGALALVWIHGLGESGLCFEQVVHESSLVRFTHIVPDMPGYGRSLHQEKPLDFAATADHLAAWMKAHVPAPAVVVGHSLGGVVALVLAERHPSLVRALVDVDGNKSLKDCEFSGQAAKVSFEDFAATRFAEMQQAIYLKGAIDWSGAGPLLEGSPNACAAYRGYYASLRLADPRTYHAHSLELVALSKPETLARRLAALKQPKFYIAGSPGGASPHSKELLVEAGVELVEIKPSTHWPFIDHPGKFAVELDAFLSHL